MHYMVTVVSLSLPSVPSCLRAGNVAFVVTWQKDGTRCSKHCLDSAGAAWPYDGFLLFKRVVKPQFWVSVGSECLWMERVDLADFWSCAWCILAQPCTMNITLQTVWTKSDADELDLKAMSPKSLHEQDTGDSVIFSTKQKGFDHFESPKIHSSWAYLQILGIWAEGLFLHFLLCALPCKMRAA